MNNKKKILILLIIIILSLTSIGCKGQTRLSDEDKGQIISEVYFSGGFDLAVDKIKELYPGEENKDMAVSWVMALLEQEDENLVNKISIESLESERDGKYFYINGKFKNNSDQVIDYIKFNIYFYDSSGNIINSEWSNWSGKLNKGAMSNFDTICDNEKAAVKYEIVIEEVSGK